MTTLARSGMLALALVAGSFTGAVAQVADFPNRPITLVVPLAPGGSNDILARLVGQKLERKFGKPVIIENRPGAGGITAALGVVRGAADGYTMITASSTMMSLNITIRKHMPYDPRKDLTPIAMTVRTPFVLVVNPKLPVHSVDDLVKLAREQKGQISFGTPGPATFHRLSAEILRTMFDLEFIHVPYKGTVPALNDLMGGHIAFMFADIPPALALIKSGKLRALGVTTGERVAALERGAAAQGRRHAGLRRLVVAHDRDPLRRAARHHREARGRDPRGHGGAGGGGNARARRRDSGGVAAGRRAAPLRRQRDFALGQGDRAGGACGIGIAAANYLNSSDLMITGTALVSSITWPMST